LQEQIPLGLYTYCILQGEENGKLEANGIGNGTVYTINYRDISAVVSDIPFKKIEPKMDDIVAHNRVIEAARNAGIVLPIRYGVIFRNEDGARKLLRASYKNFKSKLVKLRGRDEMGVKIVLEKKAMEKIEHKLKRESAEAQKITKELSTADQGASYFLKLKLDDIVKNEAMNKISQISDETFRKLAELSEDSRVLKSELDQIAMNSVYLVRTEKQEEFNQLVASLERKYRDMGLAFHVSGPWAPYSFC